MYRLESNLGFVMNSYDIYDLWRFIVSNNCTYQITKNYIPISTDTFLKMFLSNTKNWKDYHSLYLKLKPTSTINNYLYGRAI